MSIVIASLEENSGVRIFADRKAIDSDPTGKELLSYETEKVFFISDTIACGFTGNARWGITLAQELFSHASLNASELIEIIKSFPKPKIVDSTFTLIGLYNDNLPFIFGYATLGMSQLVLNESASSFSTSPMEFNKCCSDYFNSKRDQGYDLDKCSIETIKFASQQNPNSISEAYNSIHLLCKPI